LIRETKSARTPTFFCPQETQAKKKATEVALFFDQ